MTQIKLPPIKSGRFIFYVLPFADKGGENIHADRIQEVEFRIDARCSEIYIETYEYAHREIPKLIEAGGDGADWMSLITPDQGRYIQTSADQLQECSGLSYHAQKLNRDWPAFQEIFVLYKVLAQFAPYHTSESGELVQIKPEALERIEYFYKQLP